MVRKKTVETQIIRDTRKSRYDATNVIVGTR